MVKGNNKKLVLSLLVFSYLIHITNNSFPEEPAKTVLRKVLLFFEKDKAVKWAQEDLAQLYDSLLIKLTEESTNALFFEWPAQSPLPANDGDRSLWAMKLKCDAWLVLTLLPGGESPSAGAAQQLRPLSLIRVRAYDCLFNQEVAGLELEKAASKRMESFFWDEVVATLNRAFKENNTSLALEMPPLPRSGYCSVSITAAPGTKITGLDNGLYTAGETGEIQLRLARNRTYTLRADCPGYFPLTETIYPVTATLTHNLKQQRTTSLAAGLALYNLSYPEIEGTYYFIPHFFYVRAALSTFIIGLPGWSVMPEQPAEPVIDFTSALGLYILDPAAPIRFYTSLGAFFRVVKRSHIFLIETNNSALLFGLVPAGGMEFSPYTRLRWYIEYTPYIYLHPSFVLERLVVDFLSFNLGVRVLF